MKTSTAAVIAAVVLGLLGIVAWMQSQHLDVNSYIVLIPAVLASVASLFGVSQVSKTTDTIKTNTNGNLSRANNEKAASDSALMLALAHMTPEQGISVLAARAAALPSGATVVPAAVSPVQPSEPSADLPPADAAIAPQPVTQTPASGYTGPESPAATA